MRLCLGLAEHIFFLIQFLNFFPNFFRNISVYKNEFLSKMSFGLVVDIAMSITTIIENMFLIVHNFINLKARNETTLRFLYTKLSLFQ